MYYIELIAMVSIIANQTILLPIDVLAIHARLFDHRAAIHGEVNHLIRELEV